ncbi:hypothetical protein PSYCG_02650 [Psychrobacter sp. G]|uniref:hypothetical protein n=1 Tax=Psychrobacter sp. G TaxID=571800 RepID=UPI000354A40D|nr:hypothetical protein [Psychrobacter sp. G]AGP48095.1 hypothetical protein PSYCG_02650 [Psychrobacter sp. G]
MTHSNQQSPKTQTTKPKNWLRFLFKAALGIMLPYLLSPSDISIHIHHINIIF